MQDWEGGKAEYFLLSRQEMELYMHLHKELENLKIALEIPGSHQGNNYRRFTWTQAQKGAGKKPFLSQTRYMQVTIPQPVLSESCPGTYWLCLVTAANWSSKLAYERAPPQTRLSDIHNDSSFMAEPAERPWFPQEQFKAPCITPEIHYSEARPHSGVWML